jgi:thymidylate kinase
MKEDTGSGQSDLAAAPREGSSGRKTRGRRPLIIEFVGLPASGKTTITKELGQLLNDSGQRALVRGQILRRTGRMLVHRIILLLFRIWNWKLYLAAFACSRLSYPVPLARPDPAYHVVLLAFFETRGGGGRFDAFLFDQSIVQALWGMRTDGPEIPNDKQTRLLARYFALTAAPRVFVFVEVEPDEAVDRLLKRGRRDERFTKRPKEELHQLFTDTRPDLEEVLARAARLTNAPIWRIDGRLPPDENAQRLAAMVEEHLKKLAVHASTNGRTRRAGNPSS